MKLVSGRINGSKHEVIYYPLDETMQIGCIAHTLSYWQRHYIEIGEDHYYSDDELKEYAEYIFHPERIPIKPNECHTSGCKYYYNGECNHEDCLLCWTPCGNKCNRFDIDD